MEVYTPPGYSAAQKYPVIYAIHGVSAWPDTIFASWCCGASTVSDNLLAAGKIKPIIIVAMDANNIDNHLELCNVIIPYIESHYPVFADADHRGIYGYSLGGGQTFNEAFGYSTGLDTFRYISPTSAANFNHPSDAAMFPDGGAVAKQKMKCLFISCGDADWDGFYPPNLATHYFCVSNNIPHYWLSVAGGGHDGGVWRPAMWNFLQLASAAGIAGSATVLAYSQIEAESYGIQTGGIQIGTCSEGGQDITNLQYGCSVVYSNIDFGTGAASFQARVASGSSGGNLELYLDSLTGVQVGSCAVPNTGQTWVTQSCPIGGAAGVHNLYLKFTGGSSNLVAVNWLRFNPAAGVDIGSVGVAGNASYSSGVFTVAGAGADIQGTADAFRFLYVAASGDCTITARVASVQNVNAWSKAGVMIRESLDQGAANAFIAVTPSNGVTWQDRPGTNSATTYNNTNGLNAPYWVKLVRAGNTFTEYCSPNGTTWTVQGSATFAMASTAYIGLAVTSHNSSSLCTATFDNVSAPGWLVARAPAPVGFIATAASSTQINLAWNACANATGYNLKRSTNSGGPYTTIASVTATNYNDTGASARGGYYYVVSAMVGGSETPNSAEAAIAIAKLTGAIIGTSGSYGGAGNTISNVFDSNLSTFFDGPDSSAGNGCWVGLDFGVGVSNTIARINCCPRSGFESRMVGGILQGANRADFSDAVALYTIGTQPTSGAFTSMSISNTAAFRYVRYLSPNGGWGNVSELEFYGYPLSAPAPAPMGLSAVALSISQVSLVWNTYSNTVTYKVKRSITNGGPYAVIATGLGATNYLDNGLAGGTIYYYVVSAVIAGNETPSSSQAAATTLSPILGSLAHRYSFAEAGGSSVADSVGGPGWTGTLPNGGTFSTGQLTLASGSSQYASLPEGIVSSLSNCTLMAWLNLNTSSNWCRILDFGGNTTTNMFLTPQNGSSGTLRFGITTNGGGNEQQINCSSTLSTGVWHHVAVTLKAGTGVLYLDGVPVGTNSGLTLSPASLGSTGNNFLGKSQYPDPYLNGSLEEFRIYNVGLSPAEIAAAAVLGSSQLLSAASPPMSMGLTETNLVVSWPLANAGFTLQSRTNLALGDWVNVTSVVPQMAGGQWQIALPPPTDPPSAFYRLVK
jgi:enterochelin esterase-like enzyme/regulation of enolase protein 1 (concanavalin A-like superfamily)